jgi:peptidyl-dipeptidase A
MKTAAERTTELRAFLARVVEELEPRVRARAEAAWKLATEGLAESAAALSEASVAIDRLLSNPEKFHTARKLRESGASTDPALDRALLLLERDLSARQGDAALRSEITERESELRRAYGTFRGTIDGVEHSGAELDRILQESVDSELREKAWSASKQVGAEVRESILTLVELRNQHAQSLGYRDHYAMALEHQELSEERLFQTLNTLDKSTRAPFKSRKAILDAELAERFEITAEELRPWHYSNAFFQTVPAPAELDLDAAYADVDLVETAARFFDGLGFNVRPVLERSDLWPRDGKDEHAFCMMVDRMARDIRVLANLRPSERSMSTLLHELGHAAYDRYIDQPFLLRRPAHTLMTEAVAMLMGRQSVDVEFLIEYAGLPAYLVTPLSAEIRRLQAFRLQVFTRWSLVMAHFEKALYADPRRDDLDAHWWELVERYQLIARPPDRDAPDWAAKRHLALSPVYYQNYIYGELVAAQIRHAALEQARTSSVVDSLFIGELLIGDLFSHGASKRWDALVESMTGEPLAPAHFVREVTA